MDKQPRQSTNLENRNTDKKLGVVGSASREAKTGAACIGYFSRQAGIRLEPAQLVQDLLAVDDLNIQSLADCASTHGLELTATQGEISELEAHSGEPVVIAMRDGSFRILMELSDTRASLLDPRSQEVRSIPRTRFENRWTGEFAVPHIEADEVSSDFGLWSVGKYILSQKATFGSLVVSSFFTNLFALSVPIIFLLVIDKVVVNRGVATLDILVVTFLAIAVFEMVVSSARTKVMQSANRNIDRGLFGSFFDHLLALPVRHVTQLSATDIIQRMGDIRRTRSFVSSIVVFVSVDLVFIFIFILLIFQFHAILGYVVLLSLPAYALVTLVATPRFRRMMRGRNNHRRERSEALVDSIDGFETVKGASAEAEVGRHVLEKFEQSAEFEEESTELQGYIQKYNTFISRVTVAALLWFGARLLIDGEMTLGQLVAAYIVSRLVSRPMTRLSTSIYDFQNIKLAIEDVRQVFVQEIETAGHHFATLPKIEGRIEFNHVWFRYPEADTDVLKDLNFSIQPGETVGIVGPSGSGKSTLLKLILRLFEPAKGTIRIDGTDSKLLHPNWLREQMGVVEQETRLFAKSVTDNIALGYAAKTMKSVVEAAKRAGSHDFISKLPKGYGTVLSPRETRLSGGERQRLALARAMFGDPAILLLDEATSSLDQATEARLQHRLQTFFEDRTVVIVAHRLSALQHVDRILTVIDGRIVEDGTPAALAAAGRYFATILSSQRQLVGTLAAEPLDVEFRGDEERNRR